MKSVDDVKAELARKLSGSWQDWLIEGLTPETPSTPSLTGLSASWPMRLSLGKPEAAVLRTEFPRVNRWRHSWQQIADTGWSVTWTDRMVHGSRQSMPTHLELPSLQGLAEFTGGPWPEQLALAQGRWALLIEVFPATATAGCLRASQALGDVDFQMLTRAALWLRDNESSGLTARQVPIAGVHGKWLNARRGLLQTLSGKPELGLVERPSQVDYTYLDPDHLRAGGRRHDSLSLGDRALPCYLPAFALIAENKDTVQLFPPMPAGIAVQGNGRAASSQLPRIPWLSSVPQLLYWGDLDETGFEILHSLRAAGLAVTSILMDLETFETYERYGTSVDPKGQPLVPSGGKQLTQLTESERALYLLLADPTTSRVRRVEQERIPLTHAVHVLRRALRRPLAT